MIWKKFKALGTEITIVASLSADLSVKLDEAEKTILEFEKRFSRFIGGNELYRLNVFSGKEFEASDMMADMLNEAKGLYALTKGVFDPTVIGSLEAVGYDRSFEMISREAENNVSADPDRIKKGFLKRPKMDKLEIAGNKVMKPQGLRIDFGGLGKGYIADLLSDGLFADVADFWISAGGDLAVKGGEKPGEGWKVGVQNPNEPDKEIFAIRTKGEKCGIATSGIFKRKGIKGDLEWHHIIDPRTGLPVVNDILAVTAVSLNAKRADVFAKTVLILGEKAGMDFIESQADSAAIIFFKDGRLSFSKKASQYLQV